METVSIFLWTKANMTNCAVGSSLAIYVHQSRRSRHFTILARPKAPTSEPYPTDRKPAKVGPVMLHGKLLGGAEGSNASWKSHCMYSKVCGGLGVLFIFDGPAGSIK